jgi:hypothetical protein
MVVIGTSTINNSTGDSFQRKVFYASGRYWAFYCDGTNMVFRTSTDGISWSSATTIRATSKGGFSIRFDGIYVHYADAHEYNTVYYRRGVPNSDGTITWSADEQAVITESGYYFFRPTVTVDTSGRPYIGYYRMSPTYSFTSWVARSSTTDGTWVMDTGFPYQLGSNYHNVNIIALTNNRMLAVYAVSWEKIRVRKYDGSSWGTEHQTTSICERADPVVCAQGDDVHIMFLKQTTYDILYVQYTYSTDSLGSETMVQASATSLSTPQLGIDYATNNLYAFWQDYPTTNHIYYKKKIAGGAWDTDPTDWINETTDGLTSTSGKTCFYQAWNNVIVILYSTKSSSPYNANVGILSISAGPILKEVADSFGLGDSVLTHKTFAISDSFGLD